MPAQSGYWEGGGGNFVFIENFANFEISHAQGALFMRKSAECDFHRTGIEWELVDLENRIWKVS